MPENLNQIIPPEGDLVYPHPAYLLNYHWYLEVHRQHRRGVDKFLLAVNSFNLPERSQRTFDLICGPGYPIMTYPGPVDKFQLTLDITNFYERDIVEFLLTWHEAANIHPIDNMHSGVVIGRDDDNFIRTKANILGMWPISVNQGGMSRDTNRQRITAVLAVWDIRHDYRFDRFEFDEG